MSGFTKDKLLNLQRQTQRLILAVTHHEQQDNERASKIEAEQEMLRVELKTFREYVFQMERLHKASILSSSNMTSTFTGRSWRARWRWLLTGK